ncbi:MAG: S24 family peptidase [Nitrosomonas sp.]|nr:S24 family peptidase [Nitrosomonas sp.]
MHQIQEKILELSKTKDVLTLGIRPLGREIGVDQPQLVKHHLFQLQKKGLIKVKSRSDIQQILQHSSSLQPTFIQIPVVGAANCGPATLIADEHIEKYITVSESFLKKKDNVFALIAKGDSMNKAQVNGNNIEENDYVVVDGNARIPNSGDYILSVIDNYANIKKFARTKDGNIALISESTSNYPPIYLGENDQFIVNGKIVQIIKGTKNE